MTEAAEETDPRRRARRALLEAGTRWAEMKRRGHAEASPDDVVRSAVDLDPKECPRPGLTGSDLPR
jgi:hypothetical protein